ncbi:hypothetical protein SAMN05444336_106149 [Albimonas donghaensis]|uniref:RapA2 cadherin-like domain-containing protein n=1 Tax=Albimonas donghaensis TaxID=356660 RepID=A0A1H3CLH2_9RHOB|nr:Ig-like domain-containing protein [Albimonas donghaensis]SDX54945.1 hypothetical protein SAMN05444336_106149 [Albimonas donghaensis]
MSIATTYDYDRISDDDPVLVSGAGLSGPQIAFLSGGAFALAWSEAGQARLQVHEADLTARYAAPKTPGTELDGDHLLGSDVSLDVYQGTDNITVAWRETHASEPAGVQSVSYQASSGARLTHGNERIFPNSASATDVSYESGSFFAGSDYHFVTGMEGGRPQLRIHLLDFATGAPFEIEAIVPTRNFGGDIYSSPVSAYDEERREVGLAWVREASDGTVTVNARTYYRNSNANWISDTVGLTLDGVAGGAEASPSIAAGPNGFLVAYVSDINEISAVWVDRSGFGTAFVVSGAGDADRAKTNPVVEILPSGHAVISWTELFSGADTDVYSRVLLVDETTRSLTAISDIAAQGYSGGADGENALSFDDSGAVRHVWTSETGGTVEIMSELWQLTARHGPAVSIFDPTPHEYRDGAPLSGIRDIVTAGTGNDLIETSGGVDRLYAGGGDDRVVILAAEHLVDDLLLSGDEDSGTGDGDVLEIAGAAAAGDYDLRGVLVADFETLRFGEPGGPAPSDVTLRMRYAQAVTLSNAGMVIEDGGTGSRVAIHLDALNPDGDLRNIAVDPAAPPLLELAGDGGANDMTGTARADVLRTGAAGGGTDTVAGLGGADEIILGSGVQHVVGSVADHDGDVIRDLNLGDEIRIQGTALTGYGVTFADVADGVEVTLDEDDDGTPEARLLLTGSVVATAMTVERTAADALRLVAAPPPEARNDDLDLIREDEVQVFDLFADNGEGEDTGRGDSLRAVSLDLEYGDGDPFTLVADGPAFTAPSGTIYSLSSLGMLTVDVRDGFQSLRNTDLSYLGGEYTVMDDTGRSATGVFDLRVQGRSDPVQVRDDAFVVNGGGIHEFRVLDDNGSGADVFIDGALGHIDARVTDDTFGLFVEPTTSEPYLRYAMDAGYWALGAGEQAVTTAYYSVTTDGYQATSEEAEITITLNGVNDAVIANYDQLTVAGRGTYNGNLVTGRNPTGNADTIREDTDRDVNDVLRVIAINGEAAAVDTAITLDDSSRVRIKDTGEFWVVASDVYAEMRVGTYFEQHLDYTVSDGKGSTGRETFTIRLEGLNQSPVLVNDLVEARDGQLISLNVFDDNGGGGPDQDPEGGPLVVTSLDGDDLGADGTHVTTFSTAIGDVRVRLNDDGRMWIDTDGIDDAATPDDEASLNFAYEARDEHGDSTLARVYLTLRGHDEAPEPEDDRFTLYEGDAAVAINLLANDVDPDATAGGLRIASFDGRDADAPAHDYGRFSIEVGTGELLHISLDENRSLKAGEEMEFDFDYEVADAYATRSATLSLTLIGEDDAPTVAQTPTLVAQQGRTVGFDLEELFGIEDLDGDPIVVDSFLSAPGGVDVAHDLPGMTVRMKPDGLFYMRADSAADYALPAGSLEPTTLSFSLAGSEEVIFFDVALEGGQSAPEAGDDDYDVSPGGLFSAVDLLDNDGDFDGDPLTISAVNGQAARVGEGFDLPEGGRLRVMEDGRFWFDPDGDFDDLDGYAADVGFTYTVSDGMGGTDVGQVSLTVQDNSAPTAVSDVVVATIDRTHSRNILEDAPGSSGADTDPDGHDIHVSGLWLSDGTSAPVGASFDLPTGGRMRVNPNGDMWFVPEDDYDYLAPGEAVLQYFTYMISDDRGGFDGTALDLLITNDDRAPVAVDDLFETPSQGTRKFNVLTGDGSGPDSDPDGDALQIVAVDGDPGAVDQAISGDFGRYRLKANGDLYFVPEDAFDDLAPGESVRVDLGTYRISDGRGGFDEATFSVNVSGPPVPPAAQDDHFDVRPGATFASDVFADNGFGEDSDPGGPGFTVSSFEGSADNVGERVDLADGGAVRLLADGRFWFVSDGDFADLIPGESRQTSFSYAIANAAGGTDAAVATFTVTAPNAAPVANDDEFVVNPTATFSRSVFDDNGHGADSDPEGQALTVSSVLGSAANVGERVDLPGGGAVRLLLDGRFWFVPDGDFDGLAAGESFPTGFDYAISDGHGGEDAAYASFTVQAPETLV